jgi:hypothetical protein
MATHDPEEGVADDTAESTPLKAERRMIEQSMTNPGTP